MDFPLNLHLKNDAKRLSDEWWEWSVWLEGSEDVLNQIQSVRYTLHPTFIDPVRVVSDRLSKFKLTSAGWGEFAIMAQVTPKQGATFPLERWIEFRASGEEAGSPREPGRRPRILISHGATEEPMMRALRRGIEAQGVDVLSPDDLKAGASWQESIRLGIEKSDLLVLLTTGELRGFAEVELTYASSLQKPIVPVLLGSSSQPSEQIQSFQYVRLDSEDKVASIVDILAARAKDTFFEDED